MKFRKPLTVLSVLAIAAVAPAAAHASGDTTLTLDGSGLKGLRSQGVKLKAGKPATLRKTKLTLPIGGGLIDQSAVLTHRGTLKLVRGKRTATISALRVSLGSRAYVAGRLDGRQMTIFNVKAATGAVVLSKAAGVANLKSSNLELTAKAAGAIRKRLRLRRSVARRFGSVTALASLGGTATGTGTGPGAGPSAPAPSPADRPATAVDITAATIDWHVRESFIRYIATGEGSSPIAPATALPPAGDGYTYDFRLPMRAGGWYDPVSGTAVVRGAGGVRFRYSAHGIDISAFDPDIELNGAASRATFAFANGTRDVLFNLSPQSVTPSISGSTRTYTMVPGSVPSTASSGVFAGFYPPGAEFGWVTVSFTT